MGETVTELERTHTAASADVPKDAPHVSSLVQTTGYWQHDHLPPGSNRLVRAIYSALPDLVLANEVAASEQGTLVAIDPKKDLVVYADVVQIFEALKLPGRNVTIVARTLVFHAGASIDTSNADGLRPIDTKALGKSPKPDRAKKGSADSSGHYVHGEPGIAGGTRPGTAAADGVHGDRGLDAGVIEIWVDSVKGTGRVVANGGAGHAGQDGQDGQDGGDGGYGATGGYPLGEHAPPVIVHANPGAGGVGGTAGRGGAGGSGGNAGRIRIHSISPLPATVVVAAIGGAAGSDGANGKGGLGGLQGPIGKQDPRFYMPVELELLGGHGPVADGGVVGLKTSESAVGKENTLGTFPGQYECYYYSEAYDRDRQSWSIKRVDPAGGGPIRYGERVVVSNKHYGTRLTVTERFVWCTGSKEEWCFYRASDWSSREVMMFGDRVNLRSASTDHPLSAAEQGVSLWYPTVARIVLAQAANGSVRDKPAGKDPWAEKCAGQTLAPTTELVAVASLAQQWHPTQAWLQVERLIAMSLTSELGGPSNQAFFEALRAWQEFLRECPSGPFGALQARLGRMLGNVTRGFDAFGYQRDFAPNLSRSHYDSVLTKRLVSFTELEKTRNALLDAAARGEALQQHAAAAFNEAKAVLGNAKERLAEAMKVLGSAGETFKELDRLCEERKRPLAKGMPHVDAFAANVTDEFNGCDLENILDGLTMMAFAPPASHVPTGDGAAKWEASGSGILMAGTQLATYLHHGATTLKDNYNVVVEKTAVLSDLQTLGDDTFADAARIWRDNFGKLHDTSSPGILAALDKWEALVTRFANLPHAAELVHDIRALADATRERGSAMIAYNFALGNVLELLAITSDAENTMTASLQTIADGNAPELPAQLAFFARQYQEQRDAAIELVHLFNRAYAYWRLDDWAPHPTRPGEPQTRNVFRDVMSVADAPDYAVVDGGVLKACLNKIDDWFENDLGRLSARPQTFPDHEHLDGYQIFVRDPKIITPFKTPRLYFGRQVHYAKFVISPDGADGNLTNPHLSRLFDVRLLRFRVFLLDAYRKATPGSDGLIRVTFLRDSREQNVTEKGARRSFSRSVLDPRSFAYDGGREAKRYAERNVLAKGFISTDGYVGYRAEEDASTGLYAGTSPYCQWTVVVDPAENTDLVFGEDFALEIQLFISARTHLYL
jgi:hypothetical protein